MSRGGALLWAGAALAGRPELLALASAAIAAESRLMTAGELQDRIIASLVRTHGGTARRWRLALGPVKVQDRATHPDINWRVEPCGTARENAVIERMLDELRLSHSIVEPD